MPTRSVAALQAVLLGCAFACPIAAQAATVTLTLQPDGESRFFEYFSDAFAQLDRGFNNNPALDGFYLAETWETTGVYQQVGSGADVFIVQNPCPSPGSCTESNWVDLVSVAYTGSGDGTFAVTAVGDAFDTVFSELSTVLNRRFESSVDNVSGTITVSGGQVTDIELSADITFVADGQNFGFGQEPFTGTLTIGDNGFDVQVDDEFDTGSLGPYRLKWDLHGSYVAGAVPASPGTLALSAPTYGIAENGGSLTVTVNREGGTQGAASVNYATSNITATAPGDYTAGSGTLNWAAGAGGARTFTVPIVDDALVEGSETFRVTLSSASGATLGTPSQATVTIADNDVAQTGTLSLSAATYSIAENGGSLTVTVNRSGGSDGAASVNYVTANGTAAAPGDFTASSGTLSWPAGADGARTFTVPINDDAIVEGNETFTVALSSASGAALGTPSQATVTITDNDTLQTGTLALSATSYSIAEDGGSVTVTVNRSSGSDGAASVNYATANGSATVPGDYANTSGTLNWPAGTAGARTFTIPIVDDSAYEGDETFTVALSAVSGATLGSPSQATVTIVDDDPAQRGTLALSAATYSVNEQGGSLVVTVNRSGGSDGATSVNYATANGTATAPADFNAVSGTLHWANGTDGARTFAVPIVDDSAFEGDETFTVRLTAASGATLENPSQASVTLVDNDEPQPGEIRFAVTSRRVDETAASITVQVLRENGADGAVGVQYRTLDGSAVAPQDYTAANGTLAWSEGAQGAREITVPIVDDTLLEDTESFEIELFAPTGDAVLVQPSRVTIAIDDDETRVFADGFED